MGIASLLIGSSAFAAAGGSQFEPNAVRVEPGDTVELTARVSRDMSGWVEDGPFYAYLHGDSYGRTLVSQAGGSSSDVPIGVVSIDEGSTDAAVVLEAALPNDVPPGEYQITVCNDPCTTGLGDLTGGLLYIGTEPARNAAASIVSGSGDNPTLETYLAVAPHPTRRTGLSASWIAMSAGLAILVLAVSFAGRDRAGN
jgi:hypothetical protein